MRETYQNILNAFIIIFILAAAILFYNQQKAINQLSSSSKNKDNVSQVEKNKATKGVTADLVDRAKMNLEAKTKFIIGRLVSVSGNDLTVEADMPDLKKADSASSIKKTYLVTVNTETKFSANNMDGLKAGDTIYVSSKELVYQTDKLTAVEITSPFEMVAP
jgi:hypothetical protein